MLTQSAWSAYRSAAFAEARMAQMIMPSLYKQTLADTERVLSLTTRTPSPPATICAGAIEATKD
jgi:hypothetical protein